VWNGIDGGAALDLTEVEGRARAGGDAGVDETDGAAHERADGIRHAEVGPAVTARASDEDFEAARGQCFSGDVIGTGTVENDGGFEFGAIGVYESAHAAEIAFSFLADVGDEEDGAKRSDFSFVQATGDGDKRGEAGAIVGDAGRTHALRFAANFYVGAGREDGVEVRGEHDDFFFISAWELADYVTGLVNLNGEAGRGEEGFDGGGTLGLLKWRGGNFCQAGLLVVDPGEIARKPGKCCAHVGAVNNGCWRGGPIALRNTQRTHGHGGKDNPKQSMFHDGVGEARRRGSRGA